MKRVTTFLIFVGLLVVPLSAQDKLDVTVRALSGEDIRLAALYAKGPTLVTFWALWCEPCRVELRTLQPLYEQHKERGLSILAINQDSPKSVSKVRSFVASHQLTFPVALDPNGEIFQRFNGQSIPFAVLYDAKGNVAYKRVGYLPGDEAHLEKEIEKLLNAAK